MLAVQSHKVRVYLFLSLLLCCACGSNQQSDKPQLRIAVAANAQFATEALLEAFAATTEVNGQIITASSGKLTAQIRAGAPYDIFLSADLRYPDQLVAEGYTTSPTQVYANGQLTLWSAIAVQDINDLLSPAITRIALANPRTAPYGYAAEVALQQAGIWEQIEPKLVYGESIAQVNQFIHTKVVDAAFTASAAQLVLADTHAAYWKTIPSGIYPPIQQGLVVLESSQQTALAQAFATFIQSVQGQAILARFGYQMAGEQ